MIRQSHKGLQDVFSFVQKHVKVSKSSADNPGGEPETCSRMRLNDSHCETPITGAMIIVRTREEKSPRALLRLLLRYRLHC